MTYAKLKALIASYLHRTDLTDEIVTFIQLAQARISRDLNIKEFETREDFTITAGEAFHILPSTLISLISVDVPYAGGRRPLTLMSPTQIDVQKKNPVGPGFSSSGLVEDTPLYYALYGEEMEIYPTPPEDLVADLIYRSRMAFFSADTDTNTLLTENPNIFIYAAMLEAMPFIQDQKNLAVWTQMYNSEVERLNEVADEWRYSGAPVQIRKLAEHTP